MSITVDVGLLSGKTATVKAGLDEEVGALKRRAQIALGVGRGRLVDSSGSVLDACAPIKCTRLQNGDLLTLHINRVQVQAARNSFAAILGDGSVVTWGSADNGGDSGAVQDQLKNVQQIKASTFAFAAILGDGSVVTWDDAATGGDSSAVQDQLKSVQQIQASATAFAAIVADGSVVTWGSVVDGGDSSAVLDQLKSVQQIQASRFAFAALLADGSVVTWGDATAGGDSSAVQDQLKDVQQIQASALAFAAILGDGSVVTWGDAGGGGESSALQDQLKNVQQIQASGYAFAAVLADASVVTWGHAEYGGDSSAVQDELKNVQQIQASGYAFAGVLADGSFVTWGSAADGGDSSTALKEIGGEEVLLHLIQLFVNIVLTPILITSIFTQPVWCVVFSVIPIFGSWGTRMSCLNFIGVELENPFGQDDNDLPLDHFQGEMNNCLLMLLHSSADLLPDVDITRCLTDVDEIRDVMSGMEVRKQASERPEMIHVPSCRGSLVDRAWSLDLIAPIEASTTIQSTIQVRAPSQDERPFEKIEEKPKGGEDKLKTEEQLQTEAMLRGMERMVANLQSIKSAVEEQANKASEALA
ncbi:hypothetical protein AK812_SmicGene38329 [Symbiodinium microadriaticum]|uniref:E3 ubiquitin-protein ligase HERC2 n=1 Tax=Symbiodinium microadriaticum TaxID=2951 RepID=A0A1Q9CE22_SYMMI|nr:hypothetical protein AK812_SmicGene38329 [Symbiodinium microadriaticum]